MVRTFSRTTLRVQRACRVHLTRRIGSVLYLSSLFSALHEERVRHCAAEVSFISGTATCIRVGLALSISGIDYTLDRAIRSHALRALQCFLGHDYELDDHGPTCSRRYTSGWITGRGIEDCQCCDHSESLLTSFPTDITSRPYSASNYRNVH